MFFTEQIVAIDLRRVRLSVVVVSVSVDVEKKPK
jgi:hypothetical protein